MQFISYWIKETLWDKFVDLLRAWYEVSPEAVLRYLI